MTNEPTPAVVLTEHVVEGQVRENAYPAEGSQHVILDADPLSIFGVKIAIPLASLDRIIGELQYAKQEWQSVQ